jgi:hypothetical protein
VDIPIDKSLPKCVIKSIRNVENERASVTWAAPIKLLEVRIRSSISAQNMHLECKTATPNCQCQYKQYQQDKFGFNGLTELDFVNSVTKGKGTSYLGKPVNKVVQGSRSGVELGEIDTIELIDVEEIGCEEHRKEKDDVRICFESVVQSYEFTFPRWALHQRDR